jgi:hypothetical protein
VNEREMGAATERGDNERARQEAVRGVDMGTESALANTPTIPLFSRSTAQLTLQQHSTDGR